MSVVYKKMPKEQMSSVNSVLNLDETDTVSCVKDYDASHYAEDDLIAMSTGIYIINTDFLISLMEVEQYEESPRKLRYLLLDKLVDVAALGYEYAGYMKNIHDVKSYYDANMDMLDPQKFTSLLHATQKVYTKVKNEEATYFANSSEIFNSQFASGSVIEGVLKIQSFPVVVSLKKKRVSRILLSFLMSKLVQVHVCSTPLLIKKLKLHQVSK